MADQKLTPEIRSALYDFQRYLSDELAPLMALDSAEQVMSLPPAVMADQIKAWIGGQFRGQAADVPISDYLFHAVKKIHHFAELQLIPEKKVKGYLEALKGPILELCPPEDRPFLEANLAIVGDSVQANVANADYLYRQPGSEKKLANRKNLEGRRAEVEQRLSLIMDRLSRTPLAAAGQGGAVSGWNHVVSEAVTTAVSGAHSDAEIDETLHGIREAGVDTDPRMLFRYLGNSLPEWAVPVREGMTDASSDFPSSEGQPLEAMQRLLTLPEDPQEKLRRFRQFVETAVEQFNEGSTGRAVTMLGLAEGLIESHEVPGEEADRIRRTAEQSLDAGRLRQNAETPETHYLLKKLLAFFPGYRPEGILASLHEEERRDRRRLLLALIEVFGQDAREAALEIFSRRGERIAESEPYFARNLLYVLNRVPADGEASDQELRLAENLSAAKYKPFLAKEAIATLGQTGHPRAAEILINRLREYEGLLTGGGKPPHPPGEVRQLLDRAVVGLVKIGSDQALAAVVDHGLSGQQALGDPPRRLAALGSRDLFDKPQIVERLITAIRKQLPRKVLGLVVQRKSTENVEQLLEALSGTDSPEVLEFLESIRQKYSDLPVGQKAQTILESSGIRKSATVTTAPKLSGDLELFGLPNLMQSLGSMELNGVLTILDGEGKRLGAVAFEGGKITRCHAGDLRGKDAFFQLFETAGPGTFTFTEKLGEGRDETDAPPADVTPLIMEALRRFDELRLSKAIVPPDAGLVPTEAKPFHEPRETDPKLIREVWLRASSGEPPETWTAEIPVDAYRIWRLLRHWVEHGALKLKE